MDAETRELCESILSCFHKGRDEWYVHKSNDAEWVPVSEDLQEYLLELRERLV